MYCVQCGAKNELVEAKFCSSCGTALIHPTDQNEDSKVTELGNFEVSNTNTHLVNLEGRYVGFGRRFGATFLDLLLISAFLKILTFVNSLYPGNIVVSGLSGWISIISLWLYYTIMDSSGHQGTLGKIAVKIKVVDYYGKKISFARANARSFSKILSWCTLLIGFIMVAFHNKHQALHDIIAKTYVTDANDVPKALRNRKVGNVELRGKSFKLK